MADIAVSAAQVLAEEVFSFLDREAELQDSVHDDVQYFRIWLRRIKAYLREMGGREGGVLLEDRISLIRDLAYDIEDVLDEFKLHMPQQLHQHRLTKGTREVHHRLKHKSAFREISSKVRNIRGQMKSIVELDRALTISSEEGSISGTSMEDQAIQHVPREDEILGFGNQKKTLLHHLVEGDSASSKTIWVVGLPGSGKTTLVKTVYESKEVLGLYDSQAWIHVSRSFEMDKFLSSMLNQFSVGSKESISSSRDVGEKLSIHLKGKRYLLVLDDIWSKDDWERVMNVLPQGYPGSKTIVTTRKINVASSCVVSPDCILELKGLQWPQDWNLFCKRAFQSHEGCPLELKGYSQMIVKKCEGLPLAIAAVGSFLANKPKNPNVWKTFHDSLGSEIAFDSSLASISKMFLPSYKDLSDRLKSCFLYFSIFPEDYSINRGRLIRLWLAEGFIEKRRGKAFEQVAEDYLNELIGRNLVDVTAWDADGRVRSCRLLTIVRGFIIQKSDEENFVTMPISMEPGIDSGEKIRRLSINHSCTRLSIIGDLKRVRTFFMFKWDNPIGELFRDLKRMRLLRVLDLQDAPLENFPEEIVELTLIKCLSLRRTAIKKVPKSITKLAYLETLDLRQTYVTKLPSEILLLRFLRHLLVYRCDVEKYATFNSAKGVKVSIPDDIEPFSAIQKLSLVKANKGRVIKQLKKLNQLRKLGLIGLKRKDGKALCESIRSIENLLTLDISSARQEEYLNLNDMGNPRFLLQRLYLKGRLDRCPAWIPSLVSLVKIGLKWSRLNDSPLGALQDLPNLVELEMVDSYTGENLEFNAGKFKKLKTLHLEQFDELNTVIVEQNAMPELSKLTMCKNKKLEMLPSGISNLTKLDELLLYDMHHNFIASLQKNSEDRYMVDHIRIIHSFTLDNEMSESWSFKNLS